MQEKISVSLDQFFDHLRYEKEASPHTVTNYSVDLAQFAEFLEVQGIESPAEVDGKAIRSWLREMMGYGYAKTSAARKLSSVRSWFAFLFDRGLISSDPAKGIRGPKLPSRLPRALSREDAFRLVSILSAPGEQRRWADLFRGSNPASPQNLYGPDGEAIVAIRAIGFINAGVANVRFRRTVRQAQQTVESDWIATIAFTYTRAPMSEPDRLRNPLGFQVTSYRADPEVIR